jgi:hypothetical protein
MSYVDGSFSIGLRLTPSAKRTHSPDYPHLALAANSSCIDLVLQNFPFNLSSKSSNNHRLALEVYAYKLAEQVCAGRW